MPIASLYVTNNEDDKCIETVERYNSYNEKRLHSYNEKRLFVKNLRTKYINAYE